MIRAVLFAGFFAALCSGTWIFKMPAKGAPQKDSLGLGSKEYNRMISTEESQFLLDPVYAVKRVSWLEYVAAICIEAEQPELTNHTISRLWWWSIQINCLAQMKHPEFFDLLEQMPSDKDLRECLDLLTIWASKRNMFSSIIDPKKVSAIIQSLLSQVDTKRELVLNGSYSRYSLRYSGNIYFQYALKHSAQTDTEENVYRHLLFGKIAEAGKLIEEHYFAGISPNIRLAYGIARKDQSFPSCLRFWEPEWPLAVWMKLQILAVSEKFMTDYTGGNPYQLSELKELPFGGEVITRILIASGSHIAMRLFRFLKNDTFLYACACWNLRNALTPEAGRQNANAHYTAILGSASTLPSEKSHIKSILVLLNQQSDLCPNDRTVRLPAIPMISPITNIFSPCLEPVSEGTFFNQGVQNL